MSGNCNSPTRNNKFMPIQLIAITISTLQLYILPVPIGLIITGNTGYAYNNRGIDPLSRSYPLLITLDIMDLPFFQSFPFYGE